MSDRAAGTGNGERAGDGGAAAPAVFNQSERRSSSAAQLHGKLDQPTEFIEHPLRRWLQIVRRVDVELRMFARP
jgi:hypothetical protein